MSEAWFFHYDEGQIGPFSTEDLAATLSTYPHPWSIFVWRAGFADWKRAGEVAELSSSLMPAPPFAGTTPAPPRSLTASREEQLALPDAALDSREAVGPARGHRFNNFIAKNWRGEYPLGVTYWVFGFLTNLAVLAIPADVVGLVFPTNSGYQPQNIFATMVTIWLGVFAIGVWQLVAIWRSANRRIEERNRSGKNAFWGRLAKFAVVIGCLRIFVEFGNSGLPPLTETWRMAFLNDPSIPDYSIRVMRDGKEVEIAGGFKFGLTDDFKKILRASPQIKVVHLNSNGGRIGEAQSLHKVIRENNLITYTSYRCQSACTLAFAAGRERWVNQTAKLGFHSPAFPGLSEADLQSSAQSQKKMLLQSGFDPQFVERALSTPNKDMWTPPIEELSRAKVITAISDGNDFAASGFGSDLSKDGMGMTLAKAVPVFQTLKARMPSQFALVVEAYHGSYLAGQTETQMIAAARTKFMPILAAQRPLADDDVLVDLGRLYADQYEAIGAADPTACYLFASGVASTSSSSHFSPAMVQRELLLNERVIATVAKRPQVTDQMTEPVWEKVRKQLAARGYGPSRIELLQETNLEKSKHAEYCRVTVAFMREIASLKASEAALLFREIWSAPQ